jgi:hypothetical protein
MDCHKRFRGESGAILVLAVVFMIAVALLVIPLAGLATTNLQDTSTLVPQRQLLFAADGATDLAIQATRYSATSGYYNKNSPASSVCTSVTLSSSVQQINGQSIRVDCTAQAPVGADSRQVQFYACPTGTATDCPGQTLIVAQVSFRDFCPASGGTNPPCAFAGELAVGYSATLLNWTVTNS